MVQSFWTPLDIANRALQHCGARRITSLTQNCKEAAEVAQCYDNLRQAELRRNKWRFSLRKAAIAPLTSTSFFISPAVFNSTVGYGQGAIVSDGNGGLWVSLVSGNLGNTPGIYVKGVKPVWAPYFGPVTADIFNNPNNADYNPSSASSYFAGQLVYENPNTGIVNLYASTVSGNTTDPSTAVSWSNTTSYNAGNVVSYGGYFYMSLLNFNLNNEPDLSDAQWQSTITYAKNALVGGIDGREYQSLANGNVGNNPTTDNGVHWGQTGKYVPWAAQFTGSIANGNGWITLPGMSLLPNQFVYPLGAGPIEDIKTLNVFPLPAGYLRMAPENPKGGMMRWLGGPSGMIPNDWVFENQFFTSQTTTPIVLRFAADIQDVSSMDPMFCEGLAARIAIAVCETLTQAPEKLAAIEKSYGQFMTEARMVNGIEEDFVETPEDTYISVRI